MNTALHRRLKALEEQHGIQTTIHVVRYVRPEIPFPDVVVRFVTAQPDADNPPQRNPDEH